MNAPKVFISYSHDSPEHSERVRGLDASLSRDGCESRIDVFKDTDEDWPTWMTRQLIEADFVLCVVSETYSRRFSGKELPDVGLGVGWEAGLIRRLLYANKLRNERMFPVIFADSDREHIPIELQGYDYFPLTAQAGYETMLRKLLGRPLHAKPDIGIAPDFQTQQTVPLFTRPVTGTSSPRERRFDITRIVKYAPAHLIGREDEFKILDEAWAKVVKGEKPRAHILTFVALGGEGKTSLVAKWAAELAARDWPDCDAAFAWSFYSQGTREQMAASSDLFLKEAISFFGDDSDKEFAASNAGAFEKGQRLAQIVGRGRNLLILDGLEPLQYAPTSPTPGELKDQGIAALLKGLAQNSQGLGIVTTRYSLPDLKAFRQSTAPEIKLLRLSRDAGVHLLKTLGVQGMAGEFETLVEDVKGHALTLTLLGSYLHEAHGGDIRKRDLGKLEEANAEEQGGHAFHVMDAYVKSFEGEDKKGKRSLQILQLLGLFDRPMTAGCLKALLKAPRIPGLTESLVGMTDAQRNVALSRLESAALLTVNRELGNTLISLDAHPLIREYFASKLRAEQAGAWRAGHKRIYKYLISTTHEGEQPSLEQLQPLYQAVAHGCHAGLHQAVFDSLCQGRIWQGDEAYTVKKLGVFGSDLGAIACFFKPPWGQVSNTLKAADQAFLMNSAAYCLRALGRLTEALEPMRAGLDLRVKWDNWKDAAIQASNLSELELTRGNLIRAVSEAERSITYADRSGDVFRRVLILTTLADALHQVGRSVDAEARFREAEHGQHEIQPTYPLLYSFQGFRYCDLLLTASEHGAWQMMQELKVGTHKSELTKICRDVAARATQTLQWAEIAEASLLSIALDHLTLGRAALYSAILTRTDIKDSTFEIEQAMSGLRHAGHQDELPKALLTRAWLRFLEGNLIGPASAQEDLDEAWEIAERGPMRLFMADIYLYRARLFGGTKDEHGVTEYPWKSPHDDLAAARKLIEQCGYWRRKEELEDAEAAAKNW